MGIFGKPAGPSKEAKAAEARRQACEQALHDPRCEDKNPSGNGGKK